MDELREKQYELSREIQSRNALLAETEEALAAETEDLEKLEEKYQELNNEIEIQTRQVVSLIEVRENLTEERDNLQEEIIELEERVQVLSTGIQWLRKGDIILDQGEEIAKIIIPEGLSEQEIEQRLLFFLNRANRKVLDLGAEPDEDTGQVLIVSKKEFEDIIQKIKDSQTSLVVRLLASMNVIRGEIVLADISVLENKLIFKEEEIVLVEEIPVISNPSEAEDRLFSILREVNLKAV